MNNRISVILIIALFVGISGLIYLYVAKPFHKDALWDGIPKVIYDFESRSWVDRWIVKEGPQDDAWRKTAERLNDVLKARSSKIIDENYCIKYVNDYNNTVFIVSKSLDVEVKQAFLDVMKPPENVKVLFRKGPASFIELDEWENLISEELDVLKERGVFARARLENNELVEKIHTLEGNPHDAVLSLDGKILYISTNRGVEYFARAQFYQPQSSLYIHTKKRSIDQ